MKPVLTVIALGVIWFSLDSKSLGNNLYSSKIYQAKLDSSVEDASQILVRKPPTPRKGDINEALRNFGSTYFRAGNVRFVLDRDDMRHILLRHHPKYRIDKKKYQTDIDRNMDVKDIVKAIRKIISANREILEQRENNLRECEVTGTRSLFDRRIYVVGVQSNNHIRQFFPLHRDYRNQVNLCK
ncbi:hypothetical protein QT971_19110 [Microcoleus sp. herbarium19]|uniref:hypothetical protein n=1 Tax=unclassified Microcoleus TaxID=2642155 RepID=UPI002FCF9BEB